MKLPAWLPGNRKAAAEDAGERALLIRHDLMDEDFRRICGVFSDGRCVIAEGYALDSQLSMTLLRLQRAGAIPGDLQRETAPLEEIAAYWEVMERASEAGEQRLGMLLRRLVQEASEARASDIVFEVEGEACRVSAIVNDRRLPLGERLTRDEGRRLMGHLFHAKEQGTGQTSYQQTSFQGFSVRAGAVRLPERVTGLRCQRGPHEPSGDHLVARIFYKDQLEPGATLETLGFAPRGLRDVRRTAGLAFGRDHPRRFHGRRKVDDARGQSQPSAAGA